MKSFFKKAILLFISIIVVINLFAQPSLSYTPIINDSIQLLGYKNIVHAKYLKDSASASGQNKKYIVKEYRERYEFINSMFTEKELMASTEIDNYLTSLVNEIFKGNPELKQLGTHFHFSRVYWPNASSTGEGTIFFNMGLFSKLQNESQVVFVLCHELAHLYLDHMNKTILQYINTMYSDEVQQELKEIKKSKYEKNKQLDKLQKALVFKDRRHGRQYESEADSVGLVFLQHTSFNVEEALTGLVLLDEIDKEKYEPVAGLKHYFNSPEYPFQEKWVKKEVSFFGGATDAQLTGKERDSLKTHPDCKVRIERLRPSVEKLINNHGNNFVVSEAKFTDLKERFKFEIIEFCFISKRISRCLYYAMEFFETHPDNAWLATMIGKCWNEFYLNQKNHTLNQVVDLPSPYEDKNYNSLLQFIQKIRVDDISAIAYYFFRSYQGKFNSNEGFMQGMNKSKENFGKN